MALRTFLRLGATLVLAFGAAYVVAAEFREAASALRQQTALAAFHANRNVHLTLESARAHLDLVADYIEVVGGRLQPDEATDRSIDRAMARKAAVRGVIVLDADGTIVATGAPRLGIGQPFGAHDFFEALRADAALAYSFGVPFRSGILQTTVIPFARAVRDADGNFAGAVAVGVSLEALRTALAADAADSGIRTFLFRNDGHLLTADAGETDAGSPHMRDIWAQRRQQAEADYGAVDIGGAPARIVAWHANFTFPLTVVAAAAHDPFPPTIRLEVIAALFAFAALIALV
jgi:hypothetical protein